MQEVSDLTLPAQTCAAQAVIFGMTVLADTKEAIASFMTSTAFQMKVEIWKRTSAEQMCRK